MSSIKKGMTSNRKGCKLSDSTRRKMSASHKGKISCYVPDFHVYHNSRLYKIVEVKGMWRPGAREKVDEFRCLYPDLPFEVWEQTKLKQLGII